MQKDGFYLFLKRLFDIIFSVIGCIALIPFAVIVKIVYLLNGDTAPIIYRQERIGKRSKIIKIFKFRSMVKNADEVLKELLKDPMYKEEWDRHQKLDNDPRVTPFGDFLRKTSLDEFPQFLSVLIGDMSLVGPRPLIKNELQEHGGDPLIYNSVRPGITGWWAANGRSTTTYEQRLDLEYYYIKNQSLTLDVKCILKTVLAVVKRNGAV